MENEDLTDIEYMTELVDAMVTIVENINVNLIRVKMLNWTIIIMLLIFLWRL